MVGQAAGLGGEQVRSLRIARVDRVPVVDLGQDVSLAQRDLLRLAGQVLGVPCAHVYDAGNFKHLKSKAYIQS